MSRPEGKALRGRNLSAGPEAEMGRAETPGLPDQHLGPKAQNPGAWGEAPTQVRCFSLSNCAWMRTLASTPRMRPPSPVSSYYALFR